jgi:aminoglycoside 3-N-acetyltransferase
MLHSSYKSLGPVEGGPTAVIDSLIEAVGPTGTVLLPTFNFQSWTESHYFDVLETPSQMGIVGELARRRADFQRTPHPVYSFAVLGADADKYMACDDEEAYGDNSVFAHFLDVDGLIVSYGLDYNNTFSLLHFVERKVGVTHRRIKMFGGIYVGHDRRAALKNYSMFVRAEPWIETFANPGMGELVHRGVIAEATIGQATIHYCRARKYFDQMAEIARHHPEKLHRNHQKR